LVEVDGRCKDLISAKKTGKEAIQSLTTGWGKLEQIDSEVLIELMLAYRGVKAWHEMADLISNFPDPLRQTVMVREQLGFALNRDGRADEAENVLKDLIAERGPSSESLGILGRVYKDRWELALKDGKVELSKAFLRKAIDAYRRGFETDWRDHYPGINSVTLMELADPPDPERLNIIPVVRYSVARRIAGGTADYWDWATSLELAVLASDKQGANTALGESLAAVREPFEPETTRRNLSLIRSARQARGEACDWIELIEQALDQAG